MGDVFDICDISIWIGQVDLVLAAGFGGIPDGVYRFEAAGQVSCDYWLCN